jgi:SAM-dependent methyltransferase
MIKKLIKILKITEDKNLNNQKRFLIHKKNLKNKKMLQTCYSDFYNEILESEKLYKGKDYSNNKKIRLELGSGVGFIKKYDKKIITSDVVHNQFTDRVIDANKLPFKKEKIGSIFGIFCFHHFKDPLNFLKDIEKKLMKGGLCILIEPYYGPLASLIYKKVHKTEYFDKNEKFNFKIKGKTAMEKANQALSYIYFVKHKKKTHKKFPKLKIVHISVFNNYLRFLISGGLNFKKILPDIFLLPIKIFEKILTPLKKIFGIHYLIVIKRVK